MSHLTFFTDPDDAHNLMVETVKCDDIVWVILEGEADIATRRDLDAALQRVELDGAKSVHLHVNELVFADVGTIRRLTDFARQARQTGHQIKTCGANPMLRKVARMLDVQDDLGLT